MVSDKMYGRMQLSCQCGHVSRNIGEEAHHRHNFPAFCKRPKVPAVRCAAYTNRGGQCQRDTLHPSGLCHDHRRNPHVGGR